MNYIYSCIWALFVLPGFASISQSIQITAIRVKGTYPIPTKQGYFTRIHTHDIYHSGNLTLYRITVGFDSSINGISLLQEDRFQYFVFSTDSSYGLNFSTVVRKQLTISRAPVDSIKSKYNTKFEMADTRQKLLPDSIYTTAGGELVYAFEPKSKKTAQYPENFTCYHYYSKKFSRFNETLSPRHDTAEGLKLFKVGLYGHGAYYKKEKFQMPPRTYVFEFEEVSPEDIKTAEIYFQKYKDYYTKQ